jgi:predicted metal-dependent hydrolase
MVACHELAHNIVSGHNEIFINCLERVAVQFMTPKELFLKEFSFENYS